MIFAESRMAELLGEETVLVDATLGPSRAWRTAWPRPLSQLGVDLLVFVDVGGDALAHGDEPGLASPLCDALLLARRRARRAGGAAGARRHLRHRLRRRADPAEVLERLAEVAAAGGLAGGARAHPRRSSSGSRRR